MQLDYEISREDYLQASRARGAHIRGRSFSRFIPYAACAVGVLLLANKDAPNWLGVSLLICLALYCAIQPIWAAHSEVDRAWDEFEGRDKAVRLEVAPMGITVTTSSARVQYDWRAFDHVMETRDLFLLYQTRSRISHYV